LRRLAPATAIADGDGNSYLALMKLGQREANALALPVRGCGFTAAKLLAASRTE
jgi:hypothetical protein